MLTTSIQVLFKQFQEGFYHFDLAKIVDCYHLPCTLNTPDKITFISTKGELEEEISRIFEQLINERFDRFELSNTSFTQLTDNLLFASLNWRFFDKSNQVFSEFSAFYHLLVIDKKLKIINAASHQIGNSKGLSIPFSLTIENES